jgi:hypothetical protein
MLMLGACGGGPGTNHNDLAVDNCIELGSPGGVFELPPDAMLGDLGATDCDTICMMLLPNPQGVPQGGGPSGSVNVHSCEFVPLDGGIAINCVWSGLQCI